MKQHMAPYWGQSEVALAANSSVTCPVLAADACSFTVCLHELVMRFVLPPAYFMIPLHIVKTAKIM